MAGKRPALGLARQQGFLLRSSFPCEGEAGAGKRGAAAGALSVNALAD
jgi:hypothetical protein